MSHHRSHGCAALVFTLFVGLLFVSIMMLAATAIAVVAAAVTISFLGYRTGIAIQRRRRIK